MIGSLLPNVLFKNFEPILLLSVAIILNGVTLSLIPVVNNFIVTNIAVGATGLTFGFVDMGLQGHFYIEISNYICFWNMFKLL